LNINKQNYVELEAFFRASWPFLTTRWRLRRASRVPLARPGELTRGLGG